MGYDVELTPDASALILNFDAGERRITLIHTFPDELLRAPIFRLAAGYSNKLAHVGVDQNGGPGEVCIGDPESMTINTDRPEQVYLETVRECVELLKRLIEDPEYNRKEQLREFHAHWDILCRNASENFNELLVGWDGCDVERLLVKRPRETSGSDLRRTHVALAKGQQLRSVLGIAGWESRQIVGKALGVPIRDLEPAPATRKELLPWFFSAVRQACPLGRHEYRRLYKTSRRDYWLVFSAPIPDGSTMFAVHWHSRTAGALPSSKADVVAGQWTATAHRVRSLSRRSLVPRGGGSLDLKARSVLLVGCGSVGSELALRLTSAGVGRLTISDPETFVEENLYRHVLSVKDIGRLKTEALACAVSLKHP